MAVKIYHGDILFTPSADRLEIHENSYIIVEDGVVSQICEKIPEQYQGAEVIDYGDKLIIPAFSDLHVHGAQYVQRGIGMDCLLSDWLNHYTFPQESRFQNMEYAKYCYDAFVDDMLRHGIFPTEEDKRILKKHGSFSVHCPDATVNIIAGIMPLQHMEAEGLKIAMGTDIAGGHGIGIYRQVARAVQLSKLKEFYEPQESKTITITQAFYHATKESGSVFGKVGSFEKGYAFNALVIDNMEDPWTKMTAEEKLERFCYIGDDRNIKARYIDGELLDQEF